MIHPFKIVGLVLLLLGIGFRLISLAYFRTRPRPNAVRRQRNAFWIDAGFVIAGAYCILRG